MPEYDPAPEATPADISASPAPRQRGTRTATPGATRARRKTPFCTVEEAIHELAEQFTRDTGNEVAVETMGTGAINRLLASDEPADVIIGTTAGIDQAVADGQAAGDKTNVARVGIGIIVLVTTTT